tara:strand:+ start:429 stop:626 length:198 start_codon:yes stop_codon:yes gene_type:complete
MGDFIAATDSISPLTAILWCFYPIGALVLIELILRAISDDDDDDTGGGKGMRVQEPVYATVPSGA